MAAKTIFSSPFLTVTKYELGSKKYISFKWFNMAESKENVEEAHRLALNEAQSSGIDTYIAETQSAKGVLKPEVVSWWGSWVLKMKKGGINTIIAVEKPVDDKGRALSNLNMQTWQKPVDIGGITNLKASNEGEAIFKVKSKK